MEEKTNYLNLITAEEVVSISLRLYKVAKIFYRLKNKNFEKRAYFVSKPLERILTVWKNLGDEIKVVRSISKTTTFSIENKGLTFESKVCLYSREEFKEVLISYLNYSESEAQANTQMPNVRGQCIVGELEDNKSARVLSGVYSNEVNDIQLIAFLVHELVHQVDFIENFAKEKKVKIKKRKLNTIFKITVLESLKNLCQMA